MLPVAVVTGIGAQVQKPLALVVGGSILLAPVLNLNVLPVLIDLFSTRGEADPGRTGGVSGCRDHARMSGAARGWE